MPMAPSMRLSMAVNPPTDRHLAWAAQVGVTDVVIPHPGLDPTALGETIAFVRARNERDTAAGSLEGLFQAA